MFLTANRDLPGQPFRLLLEQCQRRAVDGNISFAAANAAYPIGTANAAATIFVGLCSSGWFVRDAEVGGVADLHRRLPLFAVRAALANVSGAPAAHGQTFRQQFAAYFPQLSGRLPGLREVFSPLPPSSLARKSDHRMM